MDILGSHGNTQGRRAMLEILEAGLQAGDPYNNARELIRVEANQLSVGGPDFEPRHSPQTGDEVYDLSQVDRIYVFGAGKGVQRVAKAIEEALGDRLTGGHVIAKHGDDHILHKVGVTYGGHPVPDEGCVRGCQKIMAMCQELTSRDLVFTIAANGVSALLTMPVPGVSLDDVRQTTYIMQIEKGVPTGDLNPVRNHLDMMKSGRLAASIQPARAIHLIAVDPGDYDQLTCHNLWLHNLPDCTTFADAIRMLHKWDAWDAVPASVRKHLIRGDPRYETVKAEHYARMSPFRIFGVMPNQLGVLPTAQSKAAELGFRPITLAAGLSVEAAPAGIYAATIARTIERSGQPLEPPCALFSTGELLVTVGKGDGIGGRNQEFALAAATKLAGSSSIVIGAVDTDGTDGPGLQFAASEHNMPPLTGGIVDGSTVARAQSLGVDIWDALQRHDTSSALWAMGDGIWAEQNISLGDLDVILVMARS
jgi:glycerate 2-kinase